jgi:hypothetical protein
MRGTTRPSPPGCCPLTGCRPPSNPQRPSSVPDGIRGSDEPEPLWRTPASRLARGGFPLSTGRGTQGWPSTALRRPAGFPTGSPRSGDCALTCVFVDFYKLSTGSARGCPQLVPRSSDDRLKIEVYHCQRSRVLKGHLSTSRRDSFVPTLSTLVHRHPQALSPDGGNLLTPSSTDVDQPWGYRCGQTRRVTKDLTGCGGLWITC